MQLIGSYPITEAIVTPYIGQPVMAVTHSGDRYIGTIQSCQAGQLYLTPYRPATSAGTAAIKQLKKQISNHQKFKNLKVLNKKANISFWGFGLGLGFVLPLLALAALFTVPFWI